MNNILAVVFLMVGTLLITTAVTTMVPAAYGGGNNDDHNGDGNKNSAEDESQAALADCDENDVEQAGFDCIAIAGDVEIESATLSVCKEVDDNLGVEPDDFTFTVTGNNPSPEEFEGSVNCVDVTIGPGEYVVMEVAPEGLEPNFGTFIREGSDCVHNPLSDHSRRATGEIQAGETQECRFVNHALN
jgi:hypothetical protein